MSASESVQQPTPPGGDQTERKLKLLAQLKDSADYLEDSMSNLARRVSAADVKLLWLAMALAALVVVQALGLLVGAVR